MPEGSIWHDESCQRHAPLRGDVRVDVAFIGGGLVALTAAYLLGGHGVRVAVLEARTVGSSASGQGTGALSALPGLRYDALINRLGAQAAGAIAQTHAQAVSLMAGIVAEEEIACGLSAQDTFCYGGEADLAALEREQRALERLGLPVRLTEGGSFPVVHRAALSLPYQASLHPVKLMCGLASAVSRQGGRIFEGSPALRVAGNVIYTSGGSLRALNIVGTAQATAVDGWPPMRLAASTVAMAALRGAPAVQGQWVPAGGGIALTPHGEQLIVSHTPAKTSPVEAGNLRRWAAQAFPGAQVSREWLCPQASAGDGLPLVGKVSAEQPTHLQAAGVGRWGLAQAAAAAQLLCDIVLDRANPLAELFAPGRREGTAAQMAMRRASYAVEAASAFATRLFQRK